MQAPYNDRWERTKRYLLRNFLVNPGFQLSPIPEEERSSPDSDGSLPDLIVEPAPDRHDDTPDFYAGLERRMKRYYRQLFLDANSSDHEDSSDFEVHRSMASTFMDTMATRRDNIDDKQILPDENESDLHVPEQLNDSSGINQYEARHSNSDKLIDTFATYNETSHISIDDSNKSTSEEVLESRSISNEKETDVSLAEDDDNKHDKDSRDNEFNIEVINKSFEESDIVEARSLSEDSTKECHRISTTIVEIHEAPVSLVQFDNGSPVLIPRLLQFGRTVFGTEFATRLSGQTINALEYSDENINQLSTHTAEEDLAREPEADVQRLLTTSELTRISIDNTLDTEVLVHAKETEDNEVESNKTYNINIDRNILVNAVENEGSGNLKGQDKTSLTDTQETTIDWNKDGIDNDEDCFDNAIRKGVFASKARKFIQQSSDEESFYENLESIAHSSEKSINDVEPLEVMREARESGVNVSWHGEMDQESPVLAFEAKASAEKLDEPSDATTIASAEEIENEISAELTSNSHDVARIIEDFWSVSSIQVDIDDLSKSSSNKRTSDSNGMPCKRMKKDMAMQTSSDEQNNWENVRRELFVGAPLVYRLCSCENHICS